MNFKKIIVATMLVGLLTGCKDIREQIISPLPQPLPSLNRLTTPTTEKVINFREAKTMSQKTFDSYNAFAKKFSSLMFKVNNSTDEKSMAVSIPDAYICLAVTAAISTDAARNDILSYLELDNLVELKTAALEIIGCLCTLREGPEGELSGGYNLNSLWLDPKQVNLLPKDNDLYKDLEDIFDASLYYEALTNKNVEQYFEENKLENLPIPAIELDDDNPAALSVMSVYYCIDRYNASRRQYLLNQYASKTHLMDYYINNVLSKQNYIERNDYINVYEGEDFHGTYYSIENLSAQFFLPDDRDTMPSAILEDVIEENYENKIGTVYYEGIDKEYETTTFDVTLKAPYFSIDNDCKLEHEDLKKIFPNITSEGAGERIAKSKEEGFSLYLNSIEQFSTMKFDYEGFYSCSATLASVAPGAALTPTYEKFDLTLDHPYLFKIQKSVCLDKEKIKWDVLPIVIGEVVDPNYK